MTANAILSEADIPHQIMNWLNMYSHLVDEIDRAIFKEKLPADADPRSEFSLANAVWIADAGVKAEALSLPNHNKEILKGLIVDYGSSLSDILADLADQLVQKKILIETQRGNTGMVLRDDNNKQNYIQHIFNKERPDQIAKISLESPLDIALRKQPVEIQIEVLALNFLFLCANDFMVMRSPNVAKNLRRQRLYPNPRDQKATRPVMCRYTEAGLSPFRAASLN